MIANESLDSRLKFRIPRILCKLDIEKAYDHINWNFLLYMLRQCDFSDKWCCWIYACTYTFHFSVLVNAISRGFFPSTRGLRQGDHFSLLVYHYNGGVESDVGKGVCWGLHFRLFYWQFLWDALSVSNLLFVDDTLILINFGIYKVFLYGFRPFLV